MSCDRVCHVLALLDDAADGVWGVLDRAITEADVQRARLTLARTTDPGWIVRWLTPMALAARVSPVIDLDFETAAGHQLARAAELVPGSIPLTTVLLGTDTVAALRRLTTGAHYDLLVVRARAVARNRRLRRAVAQLGISTLTVNPEPLTHADLLDRRAIGTRGAAPT